VGEGEVDVSIGHGRVGVSGGICGANFGPVKKHGLSSNCYQAADF
jgi:hypothetical protein